MAWSEVLLDGEFSVGFAPQSDIDTSGSSWTWIDCEMPQVSFDAAQVETKRSLRSRGSATRVFSGRVWPRIAIKFPVCGQLSSYAFASDTPGLKGQNGLLDFLGGTAALAYQASCISSSDGNTITVATSIPKYGCLVAGRESTGTVSAMGFVKGISGSGPWTTELFEDLKAQPGSSIARIPSYNFWPGTTAPSPLTIRVTGESAAMERRFLGCMLSKASFSYDSDWRLYCTVELVSYGGELPKAELSGSGGGIQTVTDCLALEPLVARGGARFVLGSNVFTGFNDGTVDANGSPDIRDLTWEWDIPHHPVIYPVGRQGVKEVLMRSPTISASFSVPDISDYEVTAGQFAEEAWRNLSDFSLCGYMGDTPGQIFAFRLPRLTPTAYPEVVFVDGARHRRINARATHYSGDTASTDGGNKPAGFALA